MGKTHFDAHTLVLPITWTGQKGPQRVGILDAGCVLQL